MTFARPITDRYFEDYVEGDIHRLLGDPPRWRSAQAVK
jgi:hypothetical protein